MARKPARVSIVLVPDVEVELKMSKSAALSLFSALDGYIVRNGSLFEGTELELLRNRLGAELTIKC